MTVATHGSANLANTAWSGELLKPPVSRLLPLRRRCVRSKRSHSSRRRRRRRLLHLDRLEMASGAPLQSLALGTVAPVAPALALALELALALALAPPSDTVQYVQDVPRLVRTSNDLIFDKSSSDLIASPTTMSLCHPASSIDIDVHQFDQTTASASHPPGRALAAQRPSPWSPTKSSTSTSSFAPC